MPWGSRQTARSCSTARRRSGSAWTRCRNESRARPSTADGTTMQATSTARMSTKDPASIAAVPSSFATAEGRYRDRIPPSATASTDTMATPPRADPGPRLIRIRLVSGSLARTRFHDEIPSSIRATPSGARTSTAAGFPDMVEKKAPARARTGPPAIALLQPAARVPWASASCRSRDGAFGGLTLASSGESQWSRECAGAPAGKGTWCVMPAAVPVPGAAGLRGLPGAALQGQAVRRRR